MAKKFSIANIMVKPSVRSTTAQDMGQAVQVASNIIGSIAKNKKDKQAENDRSAYFQANIEYTNRNAVYDEQMREAGNDLNAQRAVMDTFNDDVDGYAKAYKLNEQYTSQFGSTVRNNRSKKEQSFTTKLNRQNRNIVESNVTDVVVNSIAMSDKDFRSTADGLKQYAILEGFTPQEASQMIAKAYINAKITGMDVENMTYEQASTMLTEVKENLLTYDDRLAGDLIYKQGVSAFTGIVAKVKKQTRLDFRAVIKSATITPKSMNERVDVEVGRNIFTKDEGSLLKKQYKDRIRIETAATKAREIALGVKGAKAIKELEKPIQDNFKNIIGEMQSKDLVPVEITNDYLRNMMIYTVNTDATKAVLSPAQKKYLNGHEIRYKIRYDVNAREAVIASTSLAYADNVHKEDIVKELTTIANTAIESGDYDTVESLYKRHDIKGQASNLIAMRLQGENITDGIMQFQALEDRGIAVGMLDSDTYTTATVYSFLATPDEEGNLVVPPDVKKLADAYINNPATISVKDKKMKEFTDIYGTTGSGNHLAKRKEFMVKVAFGADAEETAKKMLADDMLYRPYEGVDLTGMYVNLEKKDDEIKEALDYYKSIGFTGYAFKPQDGLIWLSKVNDKWNRATEFDNVDKFLNDVQIELNTLKLPLITAAEKFRVDERNRRIAVQKTLVDVLFNKPTQEQIDSFNVSASKGFRNRKVREEAVAPIIEEVIEMAKVIPDFPEEVLEKVVEAIQDGGMEQAPERVSFFQKQLDKFLKLKELGFTNKEISDMAMKIFNEEYKRLHYHRDN